MMDVQCPALQSPLLLQQWASALLKKLEAVWSKDKKLISISHPLVASLVQGLQSHIPGHVTSVCTVLLAACVRHRWLGHQELLTAMVTQAITAPTYAPVLEGISRLLVHEMSSIEEACSLYISPYLLRVNAHPFVSILNSRPEAGAGVCHQVMHILKRNLLSQSSVCLVEPVLKYLFLHPSPPSSFSSVITSLNSDLLWLAADDADRAAHLLDLLLRLLPLHPTTTSSQLLHVVSSVCRLATLHNSLSPSSREALVELCFHLCVEVTRCAISALALLESLRTVLQACSECLRAHHVMVLSWLLLQHVHSPPITAELLVICMPSSLDTVTHPSSPSLLPFISPSSPALPPPLSPLPLSSFSLLFTGTFLCSNATPLSYRLSSILVLPLVQLLSQPSSSFQLMDHGTLLRSNHSAARSLLRQIQDSCVHQCPHDSLQSATHVPFLGTLSCMASSLHQYLCVSEDPSLMRVWLEGVAKMDSPVEECEHLSLLVTAIMVCFSEKPVVLKSALEAIAGLARTAPVMAPCLLPFFIHLSKSISDPHSKLMVLHFIPSLATHLLSAKSVLNTLRVLGNDPALLPLATHLMGKAWHLQDFLYPHVLSTLTRPLPSSLSVEEARAVAVARVAVIKDISFHRAEQHGEEMLSHLSQTLNSSYHDTLQVSMALEGVVSLCLHEVVDVVTVWGVLGRGGRWTEDLRPGVQVVLCSLFAMAADLDPTISHSHKVFTTTALHFLWQQAFSQMLPVCTAAFRALSSFTIESFSLDCLPKHIHSKMLQLESHDKSRDLDGVLPLVGSHCVHMIHYVAQGAWNAYSAFLASLLEAELEGVSRGVVYSAMQRAAVMSPHEAGLRTRARTLREQPPNDLSNGYKKCCALVGLMRELPEQVPEGRVARQRELRAVLDKKLTGLKALIGSCSGLLMDLVGGSLWEGLVVMHASWQWKVLRDICGLFYELRLMAVNSDLLSPLPRQQQQAHEWALKQMLEALVQSLRENPASAPCVFMATVGVASFPCPVKTLEGCGLLESLLLDLLSGSLDLVCGHVTTSAGSVTHTSEVVHAMMTSGAAQLREAVILSLPMLFTAVLECWGPALSPVPQEKLTAIMCGVFDIFNAAPNWYTALVLSQLFESCLLPGQLLNELFQQLHPLMEAATQGAGAELLSLAAAFIPALLIRGENTLATAMLTALEQLLAQTQPQDVSSQPILLCALHFSRGLTQCYGAAITSPEAAMSGVTLLASMATNAPSDGVVQLSLGLLLHGLSACGHRDAHSLAENVGAKWLQECESLAGDTGQVVAVVLGLAGLVGVEPVRGVAWETRCCTSQHADMMLMLVYLVADKMVELSECEEEHVGSLALWLATQTAGDVSQTLSQRERVPPDYHYLPTSTSLPTLLDTCKAIAAQPLTEHSRPLLLALLNVLGQHSGCLPPMDYSSLLRSILLSSGYGSELQLACLKCLARSKEGQGFKHLLLYCTLPRVFPFLQRDSQLLLLERLSFCVPVLLSCQRLAGFLHEMAKLLTSPLLPNLPLLEAYLRGLHSVLTKEGLDQDLGNSLESGVTIVYRMVCGGVQDTLEASNSTANAEVQDSSLDSLHSLLTGGSVWRELAYLISQSPELQELPQILTPAPVSGVVCVSVSVRCALVASGQGVKYLAPCMDWILRQLPAGDDVTFSLLHRVLETVHMCCSSSGKDCLLHQTELLHMLRSWVRAEQKIHLSQWKTVLLLALTGTTDSPLTWISPGCWRSTNSLDIGLAANTSLPTAPKVKEKLIQSLLDWLAHSDSNSIRDTILGYFVILKSCEQYRKNNIWSTVAHLI